MEWIFRLTQYTIRPPEIFISKISHINKPIRVIGEGMHLLIIKKRKKKKTRMRVKCDGVIIRRGAHRNKSEMADVIGRGNADVD